MTNQQLGLTWNCNNLSIFYLVSVIYFKALYVQPLCSKICNSGCLQTCLTSPLCLTHLLSFSTLAKIHTTTAREPSIYIYIGMHRIQGLALVYYKKTNYNFQAKTIYKQIFKMFCTSLVSIVQKNFRYFFSCLVRVHLTRKNVCRLSTCQGTQMWHFEGRKNNNK